MDIVIKIEYNNYTNKYLSILFYSLITGEKMKRFGKQEKNNYHKNLLLLPNIFADCIAHKILLIESLFENPVVSHYINSPELNIEEETNEYTYILSFSFNNDIRIKYNGQSASDIHTREQIIINQIKQVEYDFLLHVEDNISEKYRDTFRDLMETKIQQFLCMSDISAYDRFNVYRDPDNFIAIIPAHTRNAYCHFIDCIENKVEHNPQRLLSYDNNYPVFPVNIKDIKSRKESYFSIAQKKRKEYYFAEIIEFIIDSLSCLNNSKNLQWQKLNGELQIHIDKYQHKLTAIYKYKNETKNTILEKETVLINDMLINREYCIIITLANFRESITKEIENLSAYFTIHHNIKNITDAYTQQITIEFEKLFLNNDIITKNSLKNYSNSRI